MPPIRELLPGPLEPGDHNPRSKPIALQRTHLNSLLSACCGLFVTRLERRSVAVNLQRRSIRQATAEKFRTCEE
jgi:hypothetical protein